MARNSTHTTTHQTVKPAIAAALSGAKQAKGSKVGGTDRLRDDFRSTVRLDAQKGKRTSPNVVRFESLPIDGI